MDQIHISKDTEWLYELKNKMQLYAASRRLISALKANIGYKQREGRWFSKKWKPKVSGYSDIVPDELDLKWKKVTRDKDRQYIMIKGTIHQDDIQ